MTFEITKERINIFILDIVAAGPLPTGALMGGMGKLDSRKWIKLDSRKWIKLDHVFPRS